MKVLSIKEPYATLIANGVKKIETRSWKTNYRGEIFIHASKKEFNKKSVKNQLLGELIKDMDMNPGYIICRAKLVDSVYMDQEFIDRIKKNKNEYVCGDYQIGRYGWILEDIQRIEKIPAKGKLNIWNYDGEYKIIDKD